MVIKMANEGHTFVQIINEMQVQYGRQTLSDSTIYKYIALAKCGETSAIKKTIPGTPPDEGIDSAIIRVLQNEPFASVRRIEELTNIPHSTVHRHLTVGLGMIFKKTKWVPHRLTNEDLKKREVLALGLKGRLIVHKHMS